MKNNIKTICTGWILALVFELLWFYNLINEVHDQDEVLFVMTVIFVTVIVGAVGLLLIVHVTNKDKK